MPWNPDLISSSKDCTGNMGPHLPLCSWAKLPHKGHGIHPSRCHFETVAFLGDHVEIWLLCPGRFLLVDLGMWWQRRGQGRAVVTLQRCVHSLGEIPALSTQCLGRSCGWNKDIFPFVPPAGVWFLFSFEITLCTYAFIIVASFWPKHFYFHES